jgi:hypothetical protein
VGYARAIQSGLCHAICSYVLRSFRQSIRDHRKTLFCYGQALGLCDCWNYFRILASSSKVADYHGKGSGAVWENAPRRQRRHAQPGNLVVLQISGRRCQQGKPLALDQHSTEVPTKPLHFNTLRLQTAGVGSTQHGLWRMLPNQLHSERRQRRGFDHASR